MNSLENLYKMFCAPDEATASLKRSAEFGVALALLFAAYWIVGMLKAPYLTAAFVNGLPEPGIPTVSSNDLAGRVWLFSLSSTIIIWLRVVFMAAVVWMATLLGMVVVTFRTIFAGVVFCQIAPLTKEVVELAIYQWRGINSIHSVADLQLRWGLDLVLPLPNDGPLAAVGNIEVFFLWWLGLVFLVVRRSAGASRRHALLVVSGLLAYTVAVNALT